MKTDHNPMQGTIWRAAFISLVFVPLLFGDFDLASGQGVVDSIDRPKLYVPRFDPHYVPPSKPYYRPPYGRYDVPRYDGGKSEALMNRRGSGPGISHPERERYWEYDPRVRK